MTDLYFSSEAGQKYRDSRIFEVNWFEEHAVER
jgi:hypothetical protein